MQNHDHTQTDASLHALAQVARMEITPKTNVTTNVLREIRVQNAVLAEKPLMWLAFGSSVAAIAIAIASAPVLMTLLDPLNALFQSNPTTLL